MHVPVHGSPHLFWPPAPLPRVAGLYRNQQVSVEGASRRGVCFRLECASWPQLARRLVRIVTRGVFEAAALLWCTGPVTTCLCRMPLVSIIDSMTLVREAPAGALPAWSSLLRRSMLMRRSWEGSFRVPSPSAQVEEKRCERGFRVGHVDSAVPRLNALEQLGSAKTLQ